MEIIIGVGIAAGLIGAGLLVRRWRREQARRANGRRPSRDPHLFIG